MREFITTDSGERRTLDSGFQRDRAIGKGRYDLLPAAPIERLARLYERGAVKYDARNWEKGQPYSWAVDSLIRHAFNYLHGEPTEDHLAAVVFNAFCLMFMDDEIDRGFLPAELQDLPWQNGPAVEVRKPETCSVCLRLMESDEELDGAVRSPAGVSCGVCMGGPRVSIDYAHVADNPLDSRSINDATSAEWNAASRAARMQMCGLTWCTIGGGTHSCLLEAHDLKETCICHCGQYSDETA